MASKVPLLLLSLGTSGLLLFVSRLSSSVANSSAVSLTFFALLPTLVSINIVTEGRGWGLFAQLWETLAAVGRRAQEQQLTPAESLTAARVELFKAFSERWPQHRASFSRPVGRSQRPEVVSSSSSLYEQVRGGLMDHVFGRSAADAPVYFMDLATGLFLRATSHRKLVFTNKSNSSCLFHVERGKTHHWGFRAVATQRYFGQNFVQKIVAASKKLHTWEAFRVLQRPGDKGVGGCSPQVYLIMSSARFGKGMWLANKPGSTSFAHPQVPTSRRSSLSQETDEGSFSELDRSAHGSSRKRGVFLSKQFGHAVGLVYSSDLSSLVAAAADVSSSVSSTSRALARAQTAPHLTGGLLLVKDTAFQAPMLARWDLGDVCLPWLEAVADSNAASGRPPSFFEMAEDDMTEAMTTRIPGSSVYEFLEMIAPRTTRLKCRSEKATLAQSAPVRSSAATKPTSSRGESGSENDLLRDWHSHPQFGLVRAFGYRPDIGTLSTPPTTGSSRGIARSAVPSSMKAVAIEQYHSCTVEDDLLEDGNVTAPHKATLRSKIYTLSIPFSNCFSIEVLVDVEDVPATDDDTKKLFNASQGEASTSDHGTDGTQAKGSGAKSALQIRWRAGVVFSRDTMLKAQIERGALEGVRGSCVTILKLMRDQTTRDLLAAPISVRRGSLLSTDVPADTAVALAANGVLDSSSGRGTREKVQVKADLAFLPRAFALEITRELIATISDTKLLSDSLSTLPVHLPWRPYSPEHSPASARVAVTATPFFESSPDEFAEVLVENIGAKVTAQLFFEALLSDACSFFRPAHKDSGTMEVDISAWRVIVASGQSRERTNGYIRKQVFRMPLTGIPGVEIAKVEDFQYYALTKTRSVSPSLPALDHSTDSSRDKRACLSRSCTGSQPKSLGRDKKRPPSGLGQNKDSKPRDVRPQNVKPQRLEFGMKLFVPSLPEGSQFSIEVLAIVEPAEADPSSNVLRVLFASPPRHRHPETRAHAVVNPHVVAGVLRGLKQIWKQVAHIMMEICEINSDYVVLPHQLQPPGQSPQGLDEQESFLLQQSRANPHLPTHDELASRLIEAIAAVY